MSYFLLQNGDTNTKTAKNSKRGFLTCGLSLSAEKSAGFGNVCTSAGVCADTCLDHQGHGAFSDVVRQSRIRKTKLWFSSKDYFINLLCDEIARWEIKARKDGKTLCCRLNMFSDIRWEKYNVPQQFPEIEFYDYSKHIRRHGNVLPNYWVTFSRDSIKNENACHDALDSGDNVAVCFHSIGKFAGNASKYQAIPKTWHGYKVIDGDNTDLRFEDDRGRTTGRVVALRLKAHSNSERQAGIDSGFSVLSKAPLESREVIDARI